MGWCGGTDYFDRAMDLFIEYVPQEKRKELMYEWYKVIRDGDWDCVDESDYWTELEPILREKESDYWGDEDY